MRAKSIGRVSRSASAETVEKFDDENRGVEKRTALAKRSVDRDASSGVDTPASGGGTGNGLAAPSLAALPTTAMEKEHFGTFLRRARESRDLVLSDVALKTKVARSTLQLLENGDLGELPAGVYVRGFIRSFARAVGADETEPLLMYERAVEAKSRAEKKREITPVAEVPVDLGVPAEFTDEGMVPRRGLGLAVFVIILLLIATITLSLLLRRPPPSGEGLSLAPTPPASVQTGRPTLT